MANLTQKGAISVHGTNPQYLIEKVIRARVYESLYWKEHCFALTAATLIDNALALDHIGGTYANTRPTEFMCLTLKLLQLQPEKEIILEYLRAEEFKYLRALAAFYVRLTFDPLNVYETLEPLLNDYRKLRYRTMDGKYTLTTIDQFVDELLTEERVCEIQLPRLTQRRVLEDVEGLLPRQSKLGRAIGIDQEGELDEDDDDDFMRDRYVSPTPSAGSSASPAGSAAENEDGQEEEEAGSDADRYISRSPSPASDADGRYVSRSPTRSPSLGIEVDTERIEGDV